MPSKKRAPIPAAARRPGPPARRPVKRAATAKSPSGTRPAGRPFLRFHHSRELRTRTNEVLAAIEHDEDPTRHAQALAAVATELTEAGLTYFFIEPLEAAKVGFVVEQAAHFGRSSALTMLSPVIRNTMVWLDKDQLRVVATHIRRFMR